MTTNRFTVPPASPAFDPDAPYDPLATLRDIHLPAPVGLGPPAPGWWMLLGLLAALALVAAGIEWRRRQTLAYQAAKALREIDRDTARHGDARAVAAAAALLMRRVLVTRAGRPDAAALAGADWHQALGAGMAGVRDDVVAFIAEAPYLPPGLPDADRIARAEVVAGVRRWIRGNA